MSQADIAMIGLGVDTKGLKEGQQELDKLAQSSVKVEQAAGSLRGAFSGIGNSFKEGVSAGVADAKRELEQLQAMMNNPQMRLDTAVNARKALGIRGEAEITAEIEATRRAYDDLKATGLATTAELTRAKEAMKSKIGELRTEMGRWDGDWEKLGGKITDIGGKMAMLGAKGMVAGAPAFLIGKNVIEAEHQLYALANTAGVAGDKATAAIERWSEALTVISRSTNQNKDDLIGAMQTLVGKGLSPDEALKSLQMLGDAATGTGAQVNDLARAMFATFENLDVPISDTARALDMMAEAGNRGSFELKNMAENFAVMTNAAAMAGMAGTGAIAQLAAAGQISSRAASDPSTAANNVRDFLMKLKSPDTVAHFKDVGVDISAEVKKGIESGDLIGYVGELLQKMQREDPDVISKVFRDLQAKTFATQLAADLADYKMIRDAALAAVGTVAEQKDTIMQSTSEKIKASKISFSSAIEESEILQAVLDKIKGVAEWFADHPEIFGALATLITTIAVSSAALTIAGTALSVIGTAVTVIATAASAGLLATAATAIAAIAGAVAAWKVGFAVGTWLDEQFSKIIKWTTDDKFLSLGDLIYENMHGENGLITVISKVPEFIGDLGEKFKNAGKVVVEALRAGMQIALKSALGIGDKLNEAIEYVKNTASQWVQVGKNLIGGLWEGMKAEIRKPIEAVKQLANDLPDWARKLLGIASPSKVFMVIGENIGRGLSVGITSQVKSVHAAAKQLGSSAIYGMKDSLGAKWLAGVLKDFDELQQELNDAEKERQELHERMMEDGRRLAESLRDELDITMDKFEKFDTLLAAGAINLNVWGKAIAQTTLGAKEAAKEIPQVAAAVKKVEEETANVLVDDFDRIGEALTDSLSDALMRGFEAGKSWMQSFKDNIVNAFSTMVLQPRIEMISKGLLGMTGLGGASGAQAAGDMISGVGDLFSGGFGALFSPGAISTGVGMTVGGIAETLGMASSAAGALGSAVATAIPYIGWGIAILAALGVFDKKPSNKAAGGNFDFATGSVSGEWAMSGDKTPSQQTLDARDAILTTVGGFSMILQELGGEIGLKTLGIDIGERDGIQFMKDGGPRESYGFDADEAVSRLFREIVEGTTGLEGYVKDLLLAFDGAGSEMIEFANNILALTEYMEADPMAAAMEEMSASSETLFQKWQAGTVKVNELAMAFDGSLGSAQALTAAVRDQYQMEIAMIIQIKQLLGETQAMFGNSIEQIKLSVMDEAAKYDFYRTRADSAYNTMMTATDPAVIAKAAADVERYTMSAWGLLDPEQQAANSQEFIDYLTGADELAEQRLTDAADAVVAQHEATAQMLRDALMDAAAAMQAAADTMQTAANTPQTVNVNVNVDNDTSQEVGLVYG